MHWNRVSDGTRGISFGAYVDSLAKIDGIKRLNQAGDLPGNHNTLYPQSNYILADRTKEAYTYTHYPVTPHNDKWYPNVRKTWSSNAWRSNRKVIKEMNQNGLTVNLSANNVDHADRLHKLNVGPVVVVLPSGTKKSFTSPDGNTVAICPAILKDNITCKDCKLCTLPNRKSIIGFPAHGTKAKKVDQILTQIRA